MTQDYIKCCGVYLTGQAQAPSASVLMRSRYTAFTQQNMDYLVETNDPQTRTVFDTQYNGEWAKTVEFKNLEIIREEENGNKAIVEFKATFKVKATGEVQVHHEVSKFRKQKGLWYFREGKVSALKHE